MSKNMFQKLETQRELNLIKESVDLSQDIIFSDVLKDTREVLVNEGNISYRDYYKTMYRDFEKEKSDKKTADAEAKKASEAEKKQEEQNSYNAHYDEIIEEFESECDSIYTEAKIKYEKLSDKINEEIADMPTDARERTIVSMKKRHNSEIDILSYSLDRNLAEARRKLINLNHRTANHVRTKTNAELNNIKPDLKRFKVEVK